MGHGPARPVTGAACLEDERTFRCRGAREYVAQFEQFSRSRLAASLLRDKQRGCRPTAISFVGGSIPNGSNYVIVYRGLVYVLCARYVFSCGVVARAPRLLRARGVVQASSRFGLPRLLRRNLPDGQRLKACVRGTLLWGPSCFRQSLLFPSLNCSVECQPTTGTGACGRPATSGCQRLPGGAEGVSKRM